MSDNKNVYASFFTEAVEMPFKSKEAGRPIFEDREFVRILIGGDAKSEIVRVVEDEDRKRFSNEYRRFKDTDAGEDGQLSGTPLAQWPIMRPAQIRELAAQNVKTVEQLAEVPDSSLQNFGIGSLDLRNKARAYLLAAKDGAMVLKMQADLALRDEKIAMLEGQIKELAERFSQVRPEESKKTLGLPAKQAA